MHTGNWKCRRHKLINIQQWYENSESKSIPPYFEISHFIILNISILFFCHIYPSGLYIFDYTLPLLGRFPLPFGTEDDYKWVLGEIILRYERGKFELDGLLA